MFGLFKKKEPGIKVIDTIWLSSQAKWEACFRAWQKQPDTVFMAWFESSRDKLEHFLDEKGANGVQVKLAGFAGTVSGPVIFIEHHPMRQEEQDRFTAMGLQEVRVYSALDEPLFRLFGGDKLITVMEKMGGGEDEPIEHQLVTTSIQRAQEKIASKAMLTGNTRSQEDWLTNAGINI